MMREYRSAANFYAKILWRNKTAGLDSATQKLLDGYSLSYRQRGSALRTTLQTIVATKMAAKAIGRPARCPMFRRAMRLSDGICSIEKAHCAFDYVLKVSSLVKGDRIVIPFKSHVRLNHWLALGGKIKNGAIIGKDCAWIYVELPDQEVKTEGVAVGLDVGYNKLISDSNGNHHGTEIKAICNKIRRCKPGSKGKKRAREARKQYVNFVCRRLPWQTTKTFVLEDLTGMKTGKKGKRGKRNRKLLAPWSYRQVRTRLEQLAPENRVGLVFVNPHGTSRTCPSCGWEDAKNRVEEKFDCLRCHYTADADFVGAVNILAKLTTTRNCPEPTDPVAICAKMENFPHAK